jgi:hypothetical protein
LLFNSKYSNINLVFDFVLNNYCLKNFDKTTHKYLNDFLFTVSSDQSKIFKYIQNKMIENKNLELYELMQNDVEKFLNKENLKKYSKEEVSDNAKEFLKLFDLQTTEEEKEKLKQF